MKYRACAICLALLAAMLPIGSKAPWHVSARTVGQESPCQPGTTRSSASTARLVSAENTFGFRLLASVLAGSSNRNAFISPTSVSTALDMAYDGARGSTAAAMAQALGLQGMTRAALRQEAAALLGTLQVSKASGGLAVANSLWARSHWRFQSAFLTHARHDFGASVQSLDFNSSQAPATINRWVSCATQGKIRSIVDRIPSSVILYLINAVYFQGNWAQQFNPANTRPGPFTTASGAQVRVPFMSRIGTYSYYKGSNFQALRLPYASGRFGMVVVEPNRNLSMQAFGRRVTAANWKQWMSRMRPMQGQISLPRFSLTNDFPLNGPLASLGMRAAFQQTANFSGMCLQPCKISDVRHKTYLAVNEKGTVASAATSVSVEPVAIPTLSFQMAVDHPFFLTIEDSTTGAIVFAGQVVNPS